MDYNDTPIRTFTEYTYDQAKRFQAYHARRYRKVFLLLLGVSGLSIAGALYGYFQLPLHETEQLFLFLPGILMLLSLAVTFYIFAHAGFYTPKQHEKSMAGIGGGQTALFREQDFLLAFTQEDFLNAEFIPYERLTAIRETDDAFYLYVNKQQALIIVKDGFESGSPIGLRGILEKAVPEKYERDLSVRITKR